MLTPKELDDVKASIEKTLRQKVRRGVVALLAECLGSHDLNLLCVLGVDGKDRLLQIFVEEATQLMNQGGTDAGDR